MDFEWPIPPGYNERPIWTGKGFTISGQYVSVIKYTEDSNGWNDDLTVFHEIEAPHGNHYIDKASRHHAVSQLNNVINKKGSIILEVGSSSGYFLRDLKLTAPNAFIVGSDCIFEPLERLAKNIQNIPLIQFDLTLCPLPDNSVDAVVLLNVLEHIEDDQKALQQLYRILKKNGIAVIEVPANPIIYDFYDEYLKHYRRYMIDELIIKSENAGFKIKKASHLGFFLYPFFMFIKKQSKSKRNLTEKMKQDLLKKQISYGGVIGNTILDKLMNIELLIGRLCSYPVGIRCTITLEKEV
ncbi:MAG: class I SAM-dependent methyltransferase [Candidatus Methanoperedens sp.]